MARSMTASAHVDTPDWSISLRGVNQRHLDIRLKLPALLLPEEHAIKEALQACASRGRIDALIQLQEDNRAATGQPQLDVDCLLRLKTQLAELEGRYPGLPPANALEVLRWPGVLATPASVLDEARKASLQQALAQAVAQFQHHARQEGLCLSAVIQQRLTGIQQHQQQLCSLARLTPQRCQQRLLLQLQPLLDSVPVDQQRLHQEAALLAQKADICEELDRLHSHVETACRTLEQDGPVGKRLDFLMQELQREANTICSKSQQAEVTRTAIDIKVLIEQIREQVQNLM